MMRWRWRARVDDKSLPLSTYRDQASDWTTCGIGEARERNPKLNILFPLGPDQTFPPQDQRLEKLGFAFYLAVRDNRRGTAKTLLSAIQRRVRTLKARYGL